MKDRRRFQRYVVSNDGNTLAQAEVKIEVNGELVQVVNFSLSGLCVLSSKPFSPGEVDISCELGDRGKIDMRSTIVRVEKEGDMWRMAIDLTEIYKLNSLLRKV